MKVLMVSGDPRIMQSDSSARERMRLWASAVEELLIVVIGAAGDAMRDGNLLLYPAASRLAALWRAHALASAIRPDIITAQGSDETGVIGYLAARFGRIPFQLQIHADVMSPWYRRASWKEFVRYWIARFLIPAADCIRPVSQRVASSLSTTYHLPPTTISVLPVFTDLAPFLAVSRISPEPRRSSFRIVAAGRFVDREKNFSMLIDAMRDVIRFAPEAELVLVGDGPDKKNYESRIRNHGLENRVRLMGWRGDLPALYASCDVFVLPSCYEGWGVAALEAMASGLPVVMTDVGLAGEIVQDGVNGVIVPVGDRAALIRALRDLYQRPSRRAALGAAGRRTVAERSISPEEYRERLAAGLSLCLS